MLSVANFNSWNLQLAYKKSIVQEKYYYRENDSCIFSLLFSKYFNQKIRKGTVFYNIR